MKLEIKKGGLKDLILNKVDPYEIYRFYYGSGFRLNRKVLSPMPGRGKKDTTPSFQIKQYQGGISHIDFGNFHYRGDCFDFVMQMFGLDFTDALKKIDRDFGLGLTDGNFTHRQAPIYDVPKSEEQLRIKTLQVIPRKFSKELLAYWTRFYQGESELKSENVYDVKDLFLDKMRVRLPAGKVVIGYLYEERYWKIYVPEADVEKGEFKWMSTVPIGTVDGLENIRNCETALIVKSKKDKMVARSFLTTCCAHVQNESIASLPDSAIEHVKKNSKQQYIIFDNDRAGVEACTYYNQFGIGYWNVPYKYYEESRTKDIADVVDHYSPQLLQELVAKKIKL
jgi:hypothetical protein